MKSLKTTSLMLLSALGVYISVCLLDMFLFAVPLIPGHGVDGYTPLQNLFFIVSIAVSALVTALMLKRFRLGKFFLDSLILWVFYLFLAKIVNIPSVVGSLSPVDSIFYTYTHGVDFLRQDIWFFHYLGCIIGTIAAFIITLVKKIKKN